MFRCSLKNAAAVAVVVGLIAASAAGKPPRDRLGRPVHPARQVTIKKDARPLLSIFAALWNGEKSVAAAE